MIEWRNSGISIEKLEFKLPEIRMWASSTVLPKVKKVWVVQSILALIVFHRGEEVKMIEIKESLIPGDRIQEAGIILEHTRGLSCRIAKVALDCR